MLSVCCLWLASSSERLASRVWKVRCRKRQVTPASGRNGGREKVKNKWEKVVSAYHYKLDVSDTFAYRPQNAIAVMDGVQCVKKVWRRGAGESKGQVDMMHAGVSVNSCCCTFVLPFFGFMGGDQLAHGQYLPSLSTCMAKRLLAASLAERP